MVVEEYACPTWNWCGINIKRKLAENADTV